MSWLSSPEVALVGFLSALITIGQLIVVIVRLVRETVKDDKRRHLLSAGLALAGLAAMLVVSPMSWSAIMDTAARSGSGVIQAGLYPLMIDSIGLTGAFELLSEARRKQRLSVPNYFALLVALTCDISAYSLNSDSRWSRIAAIAIVAAIPNVVLFIAALMYWKQRYAGTVRKSAGDGQTCEIDKSSGAK
jgi:hypothetical protein